MDIANPASLHGMPAAPAYLDAEARKLYGRVVEDLSATPGYLSPLDLAVLCCYAQFSADRARYDGQIRQEGSILRDHRGRDYPHPLLRARDMVDRRINSAAKRLGLHLSADDRARLASGRALQQGGRHSSDETGAYL